MVEKTFEQMNRIYNRTEGIGININERLRIIENLIFVNNIKNMIKKELVKYYGKEEKYKLIANVVIKYEMFKNDIFLEVAEGSIRDLF